MGPIMPIIFTGVALYMGYETAFKTDVSKLQGNELKEAKRKNKLIGISIMVLAIILLIIYLIIGL